MTAAKETAKPKAEKVDVHDPETKAYLEQFEWDRQVRNAGDAPEQNAPTEIDPPSPADEG